MPGPAESIGMPAAEGPASPDPARLAHGDTDDACGGDPKDDPLVPRADRDATAPRLDLLDLRPRDIEGDLGVDAETELLERELLLPFGEAHRDRTAQEHVARRERRRDGHDDP